MTTTTYRTRFLEKVPRVEGTASYRFEKPAGYEFTAGQWFVLTIPRPSGGSLDEDPLEKHFTHSSSPTEDFLEFTTRLTGSEYKQAVDALIQGTEVQIEGPYGEFTLAEDADRVAFLTGGIGITPIRSILRYLSDTGTPAPETVLVYGNRDEDRIAFRDELAELQASLAGLRVIHALEEPGSGWDGRTGKIDDRLLEEELGDPPEAGWTYYVSGPPGMVQTITELLQNRSVPSDRIVAENFQGY